jgi:uncharacterized protein (TIGR03435 family)
MGFVPGRFTATNYSLERLIMAAHNVYAAQILDGPDWIRTARYDIAAVTANGARVSNAMMQNMLADRFGLRVRRETRPMPAYALVRVRADRLGSNLRPSANCREQVPPRPCERSFNRDSIRVKGGEWKEVGFWNQLAGSVDRRIVDRTGLSGWFDIELTWNPDISSVGQRTDALAPEQAASLFTALREQLGLRLDAIIEPTPVLVIERVQRPMPD